MAALGHLAAGLAHELRNPLTAMKVLIQKAARAAKTARKEAADRPATGAIAAAAPGLTGRDLAVLEAETARLERSIQTFLDFARPPALERYPGDVRQSLEQTVELVRARADQQHVQIRCDLGGRPLMVEADHEQLRQLCLNLLCNALDILPQGGNIRVSAAEAAAGRPDGKAPGGKDAPAAPGWITITIADDGPGLSQALGDRIFDPYVSTKETGLGLGLAICRRIVESHGGQITAANGPQGGAVFTVRIPGKGRIDVPHHETPL
jgi:signal transduction histidine kinase